MRLGYHENLFSLFSSELVNIQISEGPYFGHLFSSRSEPANVFSILYPQFSILDLDFVLRCDNFVDKKKGGHPHG
jgi:hypothetical protein